MRILISRSLRLLLVGHLFLLVSFLQGCSMLKFPPDCTPKCIPACEDICAPEIDPISECSIEGQLTASAKSIDKSLQTLAAAQEAESPPILHTAPLITPEGGMGIPADIDWAGPIGALIEKIARLTDYRVKVLGNEPAIPIIVTITAKRTLVAEILQNASFQAGRRAHILVFPCNRVIELRYLS